MSQFDFRGKFWLLPNNDIIDCSTSEHAFYARARMLGLDIDEAHKKIPIDTIFSPLNKHDADFYRECGAKDDALEFLINTTNRERVDPRVYAIREYGWIRAVANKFYAWEWDAVAIARLMAADAFWKYQDNATDDSWIELHGVKSGDKHEGNVRDIRNRL